ncbi:MAG: T9SS type A sorting domain-containing protein [Lentimicrobiaceae bacterium]|jgi:autotransporter-associated beta strand protein
MIKNLRFTRSLAIAALAIFMILPGWGQNYQSFDASTTNAWTGSFWSASSATNACVSSGLTNAFTTGSIVYLCTPNGTGSGAVGIIMGGIIATENYTHSSPSGTLATGGTVVTIDVASGKTVNLGDVGTGISTAIGTGIIKAGEGTLSWSNGKAYPGGFTLNAGTMIIGSLNALGNGGALNINAGTLAASATKTITTRYTGINIGGDFTFGNADNKYNISFADNVSLSSSVTRTITLGATGTYTFSGIISGSGSSLTIAATAAGTLSLLGANTYDGNTTISGGTLQLNRTGGTTLPITNNAIINGGTLKVSSNQTLNNVDLTLGTLTIDDGVTLTVNGTFTYTSGTITLTGTGVIVYGTNGILKYDGTGLTSTTDAEFPAVNGPKDLIINNSNASGLTLHANRTLSGTLTIASGKSFIIPADKQLTVSGTLTNNAGNTGLVVKSGGSLIENTAGVNATIERDITAWSDAAHGWHLLSSPVAAQAIDPAFTDATAANYDFYKWDEPTNMWLNQKVAGNSITSFVPGTGYLVAYATGATKQFTGTLNYADIAVNGLTRSGGTYTGFNLLGNPFPSALIWNDGVNWTVPATITGTAKIWDEANVQYADIAAGVYIPALNGFMVEVLSGSPASITIPVAARVHNSTAWYKSSEPQLKLIARDLDQSTAQESIIKVNADASEGFDSQYDSHFLAGFAPKFYSTTGDEQLSTNTLPGISPDRVINFGFVKNTAGNFRIELAENNLSNVTTLFLTDKKTGIVTDLTLSPDYTFTASDGDDVDRFTLSFAIPTGLKPDLSGGIQAYTYGKTLTVNQAVAQKGSLMLYNATGQLVSAQSLAVSSNQKLDLSGLAPGVYVVVIRTDKGLYNRKVIVK